MPVMLRLYALDSDWYLTISQQRVDGVWDLQIEGRGDPRALMLPSLAEAPVADLEGLLRRLSAAAASQRRGPTAGEPS